MSSYAYVKEFIVATRDYVPQHPTSRSNIIRESCIRLLLDAVVQLGNACGLVVNHSVSDHRGFTVNADSKVHTINLIAMAEGLGLVDWQLSLAYVTFGFPADALAKAVHESRMTMFGPGDELKFNEHGDVVPGPLYRTPRVYEIVARAMRDGL